MSYPKRFDPAAQAIGQLAMIEKPDGDYTLFYHYEKLKKQLDLITQVWSEQSGRIKESMGDDNPRYDAVRMAIEEGIRI